MSDEDARPLVALGSGSAGLDIVALALGAHSDVACFDDGGLLRELLRALSADAPPDPAALATSLRVWAGSEVTPRELTPRQTREVTPRELTPRHLTDLLDDGARGMGKSRWALRADGCAPLVGYLPRVCPNALVVHAVSDPRDRLIAEAHDDVDALRQAARTWLHETELMLSYERDHPAGVVKVATEDLAVAAQPSIARLLYVAGLPDESESIARALRPEVARLGGQPAAEHSPETVAALEEELQPTLALLGYRPWSQTSELALLRSKAARYDELRAERDELRLTARQYRRALERLGAQDGGLDESAPAGRAYDELAAEVKRLRFKAGKYDELAEENQTLRYKAKRYDELRTKLRPARSLLGRRPRQD